MSLPSTNHNKIVILVVEDDPAMQIALRDILQGAGYEVCTASNGEEALEVMQTILPSLILSDISMPVMDGITLYQEVRKKPQGAAIPFIFLTARGTREDIFSAKALGADDYITKPVSSRELLSAIHARLQRSDEIMLAQLKQAYKDSLLVLANAIEARDHYTREHVQGVNFLAQALARELGWDQERCDRLEFGAILHDIGKIAVREAILTKPGKLDPDEQEEMRQHPVTGAKMIEGIPYLTQAVDVVLYHHERWDGQGYPKGLEGEGIPIEARLLAICDAYHAMTTDRPYRNALDGETAYDEILRMSAKQFDPQMVEVFKICWLRGDFR